MNTHVKLTTLVQRSGVIHEQKTLMLKTSILSAVPWELGKLAFDGCESFNAKTEIRCNDGGEDYFFAVMESIDELFEQLGA